MTDEPETPDHPDLPEGHEAHQGDPAIGEGDEFSQPAYDGVPAAVTDDEWTEQDWDDDEDYLYIPEEGSVFRRVATISAVLLLAVVAVLGAGAWWVTSRLNPSGPNVPVELSIPPEATTSQIASLLEERGVVADATVFRYYVRWQGAGPFKAGEYDGLTTNQAMSAVVERLEAGPLPPRTVTITIPEGLWLVDIRERILEAFPEMDPAALDNALVVVRSAFQPEGASLEGLLFPATYEVLEADRADAGKLISQMAATFDQVATEVGIPEAETRLAGQAGSVAISPFEAIVIASLIERETKIPEEKPMVARVIYNRLERGMRLDIDATVLYAIGEHVETLTQSQLEVDSPYNTRRYPGIPPGPIGAPGRDSLQAALNPAEGDWLYYVLADAEGRHFFTSDYNEFLRVADESRAAGLFE